MRSNNVAERVAAKNGMSAVPEADIGAAQINARFGSKADMCSAKRHVRLVPIADIQPAGFSCSVASDGALNPQVDLAAKRPEIDSVSAPFSKAVRLVSASP